MDEGKLSGSYMPIHNFGKGGLRPEYGKKAIFLLILTSFLALCSFTATTKAASLVISNINRPFYQSWYDNLYVNQEQYVDRTYTFTNMPPFVQGQTYIKTENDDKGSTGTSFLTFDINQAARVYVAHDDRIVSKPSWMSSFADTGDNLVTSEDDNIFSLYLKKKARNTAATAQAVTERVSWRLLTGKLPARRPQATSETVCRANPAIISPAAMR